MAKKTIAQWIVAFGGWIVQNFPNVQTGGVIKIRDYYNMTPADTAFNAWFDQNMIDEGYDATDKEQLLDVPVAQFPISGPSV